MIRRALCSPLLFFILNPLPPLWLKAKLPAQESLSPLQTCGEGEPPTRFWMNETSCTNDTSCARATPIGHMDTLLHTAHFYIFPQKYFTSLASDLQITVIVGLIKHMFNSTLPVLSTLHQHQPCACQWRVRWVDGSCGWGPHGNMKEISQCWIFMQKMCSVSYLVRNSRIFKSTVSLSLCLGEAPLRQPHNTTSMPVEGSKHILYFKPAKKKQTCLVAWKTCYSSQRFAATMVRKLKYHEQKLLKKVDFINWEVDNNLHEVKVLRKYRIEKREDYTKWVSVWLQLMC